MIDYLIVFLLSTVIAKSMSILWAESEISAQILNLLFIFKKEKIKNKDEAENYFIFYLPWAAKFLYCDYCRPSVFSGIIGLSLCLLFKMNPYFGIFCWLGGFIVSKILDRFFKNP